MAKRKLTVVRKEVGVPGTPTRPATVDERRHMIAEAAYYRALQRGFQGGDPVDDWLQAEKEIAQATQSRP